MSSAAAEILGECVRLRKHYLEDFAKKYDSNYIQGFSTLGGSGRDDVPDDISSGPSPSTTAKYNSYDGDNTLHPFVLLLGNHSSGKSSFINYLLGRKVQATGKLQNFITRIS
jgi:ribosome biogenesis GTPase A